MFTGIVQKTGEVVALERSQGSGRLRISAAPWPAPLQTGESIANNGVCLTLTSQDGNVLSFDVLNETFEKTNLGDQHKGSLINLERSLCVGDSIGGHFVTGHVDGTGRVAAITPIGRDWILEIACGKDLLAGMVKKGSIAIDGVSLTIVELRENSFTVHLIPHTWQVTAFHKLKQGSRVNLETDMLGKYVQRILAGQKADEGITWEKLRSSGFTA